MNKHTPGPWYWDFDRDHNWSLCSDSVTDVIMDQRNCPLIEDRILIAAAPDLLEALENLMDVYSEPDERICCNGADCGCMGATRRQQAEHYAREAIAKAKGGK